jgi:hypothetical protein
MMSSEKILLIAFLAVLALPAAARAPNGFPELSGPYLGQAPPGKTAKIFAPGVISTDLHDDAPPVFTKAGREVYFRIVYQKAGQVYATIFCSKEENGIWTAPAQAPFAKDHFFGRLTLSPDGKKLYTSVKNGKSQTDPAYLERKGSTWNGPVIISELSSPYSDMNFFESCDGHVYWTVEEEMNSRTPKHYTAKITGNGYSKPERITSFPPTALVDFYARDGSYVVFTASAGGWNYDIFVCFRNKDGGWGRPVNMGPAVNKSWSMEKAADLSPDGKYLFFLSDRQGAGTQPKKLWHSDLLTDLESVWRTDVYWVDASIIDDLKRSHAR